MEYVVHDPRLKNWYICFSDSVRLVPGQKYLKKGFRHVKAFAFDDNAAVWLTFDPGHDGIVIRAIKNDEQIVNLIANAYRAGPVLYCEVEGKIIWKPRFIMACTSQICHLLGVNLFVHTPWRLFCALKKLGASELIFKDN
jgi:hypothetical protein